MSWVYPRVGGETYPHLRRRRIGKGLSPRGRGNLGVCRIGRTEEAKECWSGLRSDYRLHESMLSQIVELGYPLPQT